MKKISLLNFCFFVVVNCFAQTTSKKDETCFLNGDAKKTNSNVIDGHDTSATKVYETYTLTFWCNFQGSGAIRVYVNDAYRGQITKYYATSIPSCYCDGCVSVNFTSTGSLTYYATDGVNTWGTSDNPKTLTIDTYCKTMNLHL